MSELERRLAERRLSLAEAANLIGKAVAYVPVVGPREHGVITSVSSSYVFVRYGTEQPSKATRAQDLIALDVT